MLGKEIIVDKFKEIGFLKERIERTKREEGGRVKKDNRILDR